MREVVAVASSTSWGERQAIAQDVMTTWRDLAEVAPLTRATSWRVFSDRVDHHIEVTIGGPFRRELTAAPRRSEVAIGGPTRREVSVTVQHSVIVASGPSRRDVGIIGPRR
jgi:hypothetical protein